MQHPLLSLLFFPAKSAVHQLCAEFRKVRGRLSVWKTIQESKDPSTFTVISKTRQHCWPDRQQAARHLPHGNCIYRSSTAASVIIGLILVTSWHLCYKARLFWSAKGRTGGCCGAFATSLWLMKAGTRAILTMYFGPHNIPSTMNVQFRKELSGGPHLECSPVDRIETATK